MSELAEGQEGEVVEGEEGKTPPAKETPKVSRADWEQRQMDKAAKSGWKDFDAFVAEGGDPDSWKTADAFNQFKDFRETLNRKERQFNERLEGVQRLTEAQLAAQRQQLESERDALINAGGKGKEVKAIEKQIQATYVAPAPQVDEDLAKWNAENQWINEKTPKAVYARTVWADLLAAQTPIPQALEKLEAEIKKHYPPQARQTVTLPESEAGKGAKGFTKTPKAATMDSLTEEERRIWNISGQSMWKGDTKKFLQAVQDVRSTAKGDKS